MIDLAMLEVLSLIFVCCSRGSSVAMNMTVEFSVKSKPFDRDFDGDLRLDASLGSTP